MTAAITSRVRDYFRGFALRQVRIACGLVMFCYLLSHFTNHALGNISYAAIKEGLAVHMAIWRFAPLAVGYGLDPRAQRAAAGVHARKSAGYGGSCLSAGRAEPVAG